MAFSKRADLIPIEVYEIKQTKEMVMKVLQSNKQECKSRIVKLKQDIEDLKVAKIAELEHGIMQAEAELKQLEEHEKMVVSSVDAKEVK